MAVGKPIGGFDIPLPYSVEPSKEGPADMLRCVFEPLIADFVRARCFIVTEVRDDVFEEVP